MKIIDLHTHTTHSDGTLTPKEIITLAKELNISAIAITDHDALSAIEEAEHYAKIAGIEVIPGIEISTEYNGFEIHMIGLFIDRYNTSLNHKIEDFVKSREERNILIVKKLQELNIDISYSDILNQTNNSAITRAHIARELMNKGYVKSADEAFDRYLGYGKKAFVKRELINWQESIDLIKKSGGIAILAHPILYKLSYKKLEEIVANMASHGLDAIEAYYSSYSLAEAKYIKTLALKNKLALSGGSDFHGNNKPKIQLGSGYGDLQIPYSVLEVLKEKLNE